jgi:hypothetical protein
VDFRDHARAADTRLHAVASEGAQLLGHYPRSSMDVEQQFGMGVKVPPPFAGLPGRYPQHHSLLAFLLPMLF